MRGLAIGVVLTLGCYHPSIAMDVPCGPGGACPQGQTCDTGEAVPTCVGMLPSDGAVDAVSPVSPAQLCGDTSGLQLGAAWPLIHGCPTNAGRTSFLGPATGATAVDPIGTITARRGAVVGAGNQIVVEESGTGAVYAFDGATGAQTWASTASSGAGTEPFPALDAAGIAYATTDYGKLYAIDVATGTEAWELQLGGAFSAPVMSAPGTLYYGSRGPYGFYAVDTVARAKKWHFDVPNSGDASTAPAIGATMVYFVDTKNSQLFALDAATGAQVFDVAVPGAATGSPVLGVDTLYVATLTSGIAAFDAQTGAAKWQFSPGSAVVQPALLSTGDVVSSTTDGIAFVIDRGTGHMLETFAIGANLLGPPVVDPADTIYFASDQGTMAYAAASQSRVWISTLIGPIVMANMDVVVLPAVNTLAVIGP